MYYGGYHDHDRFIFEPPGGYSPHQYEKFEFEPRYYGALTEPKFEFQPQIPVETIEGQIAMVRVSILRVLQYDPHNYDLLFRRMRILCRLVKKQFAARQLERKDKSPWDEINIEEIAESMGYTLNMKPH